MMNTFIKHSMRLAECRNPFNNRNKPITVLHYNKSMGAIDSVDRTTKPYQTARRTLKWYRKVFFYFLDIAVYNSRILYNMLQTNNADRKSYKEFLMMIMEEIFTTFPPGVIVRGRPPSVSNAIDSNELIQHDILKMKTSAGKTSFQDCVWCRQKKIRKMTMFTCGKCGVRLCPYSEVAGQRSCFNLFHAAKVSRYNSLFFY